MKKIYSLLFVLLISLSVLAQSSDGFKYQAIIRDAAGNVNANASISMEISIIQGSADGMVVFTETHSAVSNAYGLVNLAIGSQNPTDFALIDWANAPYFIKISVDGIEFGISQLLSVPYALHAKTAVESDPIFTASSLVNVTQTNIDEWSNKLSEFIEADPIFAAAVASKITETDTAYWNSKLDEFIEIDPIFAASLASAITGIDTAYWNSKLDSIIEKDSIFLVHPSAGITADNIENWNMMYWYLFERSEIKLMGDRLDNLEAFHDGIFDIEGNKYDSIRIGEQVWMTTNLRTSYYSDGTPIFSMSDELWLDEFLLWWSEMFGFPFGEPTSSQSLKSSSRESFSRDRRGTGSGWFTEIEDRIASSPSIQPSDGEPNKPFVPSESMDMLHFLGAYTWPDSVPANEETYGKLYNFYAVATEKLCPVGWHVPDATDWMNLAMHLGGNEFAGGKIKEGGTLHWSPPNTGATNESGFTALPAGLTLVDMFNHPPVLESIDFGEYALFWAYFFDPIDSFQDIAGYVELYHDNAELYLGPIPMDFGLSVRCIKDDGRTPFPYDFLMPVPDPPDPEPEPEKTNLKK